MRWFLPMLLGAMAPSSVASPGLFGEPGLWFIPTAESIAYGQCAVGVNIADDSMRPYDPKEEMNPLRATTVHYLNLVVVPGVDVTMRITNIDGKLFAQYFQCGERPNWINRWGYPVGGYNVDRSLGVRLLLCRQHGLLPALAIGSRDITGAFAPFRAQYAVASWFGGSNERSSLPRTWGIHLGVGTGRLQGLFAGAEYAPWQRFSIAGELAESKIHVGFRWNVTQRLQVQPALLGGRVFGGGAAYTWQM